MLFVYFSLNSFTYKLPKSIYRNNIYNFYDILTLKESCYVITEI